MKKKKYVYTAVVMLTALLLAGCAGSVKAKTDGGNGAKDKKEESSGKVSFQDDRGKEVTVQNPENVAALSGSLAHIWTLAGGEPSCVTSDALEEARIKLPEDVVNAGRLSEPSAETILGAGVDFAILTSTLEGHIKLAETLEETGIPTACLEVETFDEYLSVLDIFTRITGRADLYERYGTDVKAQVDARIEACEGKEGPDVLLIRAYGTGAKAKNSDNNMTGAMLKDLGCRNIADRDNSILEDLSIEKIIEEDPDFIFVTTMGDDEAAMDVLAKSLTENPAWGTLSAVREDRYIVLPKDLFHYKPNDRWGESYEMLADILYGGEQKQ